MSLKRTRAYGLTALLAVTLSIGGCSNSIKPYDIELPAPISEPSEELLIWDEEVAPAYYAVIGKAEVGDVPEPGQVIVYDLDPLGRATGAVANVTYESIQGGRARKREDISDLHPSGWSTNTKVEIVTPTGSLYHGYFWNRSHLIAKTLGGPDTIENLICGTRMQNVGANDGHGGMGYPETIARDWLDKHHNGSVYVRAIPNYAGDEPIPRSVTVDLLTSDNEYNMRIVVYNAAKGFEINYDNGTFTEAKK